MEWKIDFAHFIFHCQRNKSSFVGNVREWVCRYFPSRYISIAVSVAAYFSTVWLTAWHLTIFEMLHPYYWYLIRLNMSLAPSTGVWNLRTHETFWRWIDEQWTSDDFNYTSRKSMIWPSSNNIFSNFLLLFTFSLWSMLIFWSNDTSGWFYSILL